MTSKAIYPGAFDPFTNGHLDVLERALNIFDEVIVVIAENCQKHALFTIDEREVMTREVTGEYPGVSVEVLHKGLLADYARQVGAKQLFGAYGKSRILNMNFKCRCSTVNSIRM